MKKPVIAVLFHNYYGQHTYWLDNFFNNIPRPFFLFYNIVSDSLYNTGSDNVHSIRLYCRQKKYDDDMTLVITKAFNKGRDIGGKLVLLDALLRANLQTDYLYFLHDKKSFHSVNAQNWSQGLLKIARSQNTMRVIDIFSEERKTGIIATDEFIRDEYDTDTNEFTSTNGRILRSQQEEYGIFPGQYKFVAGAMFAARFDPVIDFFKKNSPLQIRKTLEAGNVVDDFEGTYVHSWERLLSWIVLAKGYNLKGI